jgi:transposase
MREVSADKAYSSKANLQAVIDHGAQPFVPFKGVVSLNSLPPKLGPVHSTWIKLMHQFAYQRDTFLVHYHKRSNVETTFSMIKRKFGPSLRSKSPVGQINEVLCKVICHNLCVIIASIYELGLEMPTFAQAS